VGTFDIRFCIAKLEFQPNHNLPGFLAEYAWKDDKILYLIRRIVNLARLFVNKPGHVNGDIKYGFVFKNQSGSIPCFRP
jgi:hypothetical protein